MTVQTDLRAGDGFAGQGDAFYEKLIAAHDGLNDDQSAALNARLILILANEVGDLARLDAAISLARAAGQRQDQGSRS